MALRLLCLLLILPSAAWAQCWQNRAAQSGRVLPSSSDGAVPTNTLVWYLLGYTWSTDADEGWTPDVDLQNLGTGGFVDLELIARAEGREQTLWVFQPAVELRPGTEYEISYPPGVGEGGFLVEPLGDGRPDRRRALIRTGEGPDREAPPTPVAVGHILEMEDLELFDQGCPQEQYVDQVRFLFEDPTGLVLAARPADARALGDSLDGELEGIGDHGEVLMMSSFTPNTRLELRFRAVDLAGNPSPWGDVSSTQLPGPGCRSEAHYGLLLLFLPLLRLRRRVGGALGLALALTVAGAVAPRGALADDGALRTAPAEPELDPDDAPQARWGGQPAELAWRRPLYTELGRGSLAWGTVGWVGIGVGVSARIPALLFREQRSLDLMLVNVGIAAPSLVSALTLGLMQAGLVNARTWRSYKRPLVALAWTSGTLAVVSTVGAVPGTILAGYDRPAAIVAVVAVPLAMWSWMISTTVVAAKVGRIHRDELRGRRRAELVAVGPTGLVLRF